MAQLKRPTPAIDCAERERLHRLWGYRLQPDVAQRLGPRGLVLVRAAAIAGRLAAAAHTHVREPMEFPTTTACAAGTAAEENNEQAAGSGTD